MRKEMLLILKIYSNVKSVFNFSNIAHANQCNTQRTVCAVEIFAKAAGLANNLHLVATNIHPFAQFSWNWLDLSRSNVIPIFSSSVFCEGLNDSGHCWISLDTWSMINESMNLNRRKQFINRVHSGCQKMLISHWESSARKIKMCDKIRRMPILHSHWSCEIIQISSIFLVNAGVLVQWGSWKTKSFFITR